MTIPPTVRVKAPGDLPAGYNFEATLLAQDGERTFVVTVPAGGVRQGEEIEVPYPTQDTIVVQADRIHAEEAHPMIHTTGGEQGIVDNLGGAPSGRWRHGLCDCCEVCCCSEVCCMACCCDVILLGQLLQRFKLDCCGVPTKDFKNTCQNMLLIFLVYILIGSIPPLGLVFLIFLLVAGSRLRVVMRKKYNIPSSTCCGDYLDDCCCICWCTCCTFIQMARQSHNEKEYPYSCCTPTGLHDNAPEVIPEIIV